MIEMLSTLAVAVATRVVCAHRVFRYVCWYDMAYLNIYLSVKIYQTCTLLVSATTSFCQPRPGKGLVALKPTWDPFWSQSTILGTGKRRWATSLASAWGACVREHTAGHGAHVEQVHAGVHHWNSPILSSCSLRVTVTVVGRIRAGRPSSRCPRHITIFATQNVAAPPPHYTPPPAVVQRLRAPAASGTLLCATGPQWCRGTPRLQVIQQMEQIEQTGC